MRCLNQKMVMILHKNIAIEHNLIVIQRELQGLEKLQPVRIVFEYLPFFVTTAGDVIERSIELYSQSSCHGC